jgi:hypothetical protein
VLDVAKSYHVIEEKKLVCGNGRGEENESLLAVLGIVSATLLDQRGLNICRRTLREVDNTGLLSTTSRRVLPLDKRAGESCHSTSRAANPAKIDDSL